MLHARRFTFSKQIGDGITIYNPSDELPRTKVKTNKTIQDKLDRIFTDRRVEYKFSEFAEVNNGIYGLMDVIDNNECRFKFLHGLVSEGLHKVENIEETSDSIFIVTANDISNNKNMDEESFKDRIEKIEMNYILDVETQLKVYFDNFGTKVKDYFLPEVLENFAKIIISSRLKPTNAVKSD